MKPLVLIIMDGFGITRKRKGNAIARAKTPNLDHLKKSYPYKTICASGECVGLPKGQMGNSEVGHQNIGAGRVVLQDFVRIDKAIKNGSFFKNTVLTEPLKKHKKVHLVGLVSDGGVHSHIRHLKALIKACEKNGVEKIILHAITDGRDTPPKSAMKFIKEIKRYKKDLIITTVSGRYYAMDRDRRWERTRKAYESMIGNYNISAKTPEEAIEKAYNRGETDEFIKPTFIEGGEPIKENDLIIFFNFRPDRMRQLVSAFGLKEFDEFARKIKGEVITFTKYDDKFNFRVLFDKEIIPNIFGEIISKAGLKQLRIAETEKYAHVTYFFNSLREKPFKKEDRILINSPRDVPTYDLKPEMSAYEITSKLLEVIHKYDVVILNYANCDMVGHTGVFEAAVKAVETVDECVGKVIRKVKELEGEAIIIADHGNAEEMIDYKTGRPHTAHTTNPVPFILISKRYKNVTLRDNGKLCDVAPTMLKLLNIKKPKEMTGRCMFK